MFEGKITIELCDEFRLFLTTMTFGKSDAIVPTNLSHRYLLKNFNISKNIRNYYHSPCQQLISENEYNEFAKILIVGDRETFLNAYPINFKGAYVFRNQFHFWLIQATFRNFKFNGIEIKKFEDFFPVLEEYKLGFKQGFDIFEKNCIETFLPMFPDKTDFITKVFEYVTKNFIETGSWVNSNPGLATNHKKEIIEVKNYGIEQGYFYKAWSIILSNNNLFQDLFDKRCDKNNFENFQNEKKKIDEEIEIIELAIREIIAEKIDSNIYSETVPQNIRNKISDRIEISMKKQPSISKEFYNQIEKKLMFFDISDCFDIISNKKNWILFESIFQNKNVLQDKFIKLSDLRNCIRHSRPINEVTFLEGKASVLWFQQIFKNLVNNQISK